VQDNHRSTRTFFTRARCRGSGAALRLSSPDSCNQTVDSGTAAGYIPGAPLHSHTARFPLLSALQDFSLPDGMSWPVRLGPPRPVVKPKTEVAASAVSTWLAALGAAPLTRLPQAWMDLMLRLPPPGHRLSPDPAEIFQQLHYR